MRRESPERSTNEASVPSRDGAGDETGQAPPRELQESKGSPDHTDTPGTDTPGEPGAPHEGQSMPGTRKKSSRKGMGPGHGNTSSKTHGGMEAELESTISALEAKRAEYEELNRRYLRLAADFDNYRKRTRRELGDAAMQATGNLVLSLLDVLDDLERALQDDSPAANNDAFREGIAMTYSRFRSILDKEGLNPIEARGKPFDPMVHEAVSVIHSSEVEDGTVIEVIQEGYRLGERLLRPSKVVVARGPPVTGDEDHDGKPPERAFEPGSEKGKSAAPRHRDGQPGRD